MITSHQDRSLQVFGSRGSNNAAGQAGDIPGQDVKHHFNNLRLGLSVMQSVSIKVSRHTACIVCIFNSDGLHLAAFIYVFVFYQLTWVSSGKVFVLLQTLFWFDL